ncbi:MAG: hypothetical protein AAFX78_03235 [Cyanobacteria bacterium J06638_20]
MFYWLLRSRHGPTGTHILMGRSPLTPIAKHLEPSPLPAEAKSIGILPLHTCLHTSLLA